VKFTRHLAGVFPEPFAFWHLAWGIVFAIASIVILLHNSLVYPAAAVAAFFSAGYLFMWRMLRDDQ
jgi:hypothetical protein